MASKVLLVEDDPARAQRIGDALVRCSFESFHTTGADEAEEALGIRQFDIVLLSSLAKPTDILRRLQAVTRELCSSAKFFVWGPCDAGLCDGVLPEHISESELCSELSGAQKRAAASGDDAASRLPAFDLPGFRQQMGDDPELMREIIAIFFEESAGQMRELSETMAHGDLGRASRLAHSLKGSLGSLHAARSRHWAQVLESAAAAGDSSRGKAALVSLSQAIDELLPDLREALS
jgi:HPt (histidine-containing phosphotransfer) domain-containing protein